MQLNRGPALPYDVIAGVVPCRGGWLVASAKVHGVVISPEDPRVMSTFLEVIDEKPLFSIIALNAPIGLLEESVAKGRTCDREARALLGARRGAAIRSAPSRSNFGAADDKRKGLDAVSAALLPRYEEIATEMAPFLQRRVYEVNPELSFFELNHEQPLTYAKRFEYGRDERCNLLRERIQGVERVIDAKVPGATPAQLIDAAACIWAARRILAHSASRLPQDPEWDEKGLRMEIVR